MMKPFVIGICGGSGSGKTTLLKKITSYYGVDAVSVFTMDNYYFTIDQQAKDKNGVVNFDLPTALNKAALVNDLRMLLNGQEIQVKEYFFNSPPDKNVMLTIEPKQIIIVEGLFLFHYTEVFELLDFSVFVDVDMETQLDRRIYRDQESRGYDVSDIVYQWKNHVTPCYQNYIQPFKKEASFIYRNDKNFEKDFLSLIEILSENFTSIK
ncbi:AAA family ATPase [Crocinitomicaceae bacterium]|nr:AAA family ATPase [Crocinitomicaceae bacterium]